jgi:hypothetical protein
MTGCGCSSSCGSNVTYSGWGGGVSGGVCKLKEGGAVFCDEVNDCGVFLCTKGLILAIFTLIVRLFLCKSTTPFSKILVTKYGPSHFGANFLFFPRKF